jgi:hypothetical protein
MKQERQKTPPNKNHMKNLHKFLSATAIALTLSAISSARAGEPAASPRIALNQTRVVSASATKDPNLLASLPAGNARSWAHQQSVRTVPSTGTDIDLAHVVRPNLSPRNPAYESAMRQSAAKQFQVAPLK